MCAFTLTDTYIRERAEKDIWRVYVRIYTPECVSAQCMCVRLLFKGGKAGALLKAY